MPPKTFYITTAIDYTNAAPHIGHAYEKVLADVIARYHRLKGEEVFFLTGVDQHGQKVQQSAEKRGIPPQQFVDEITAKFRALWEKLDVDYTAWAQTTDALHKENVRKNLQILWDDQDPATGESRWLYKKTQRGFYSVRQEQFLTDKERNEQGEFGPEWQPVEEREEENFYFRLTQDRQTGAPGFDPKQWLLDFIDKRNAQEKPFIVPDFRVAELRNAVEKLEGDLCISRPASRLKWGIPFPESFGAGFVTYVWFDALLNYLSFVPGHDPHFGEHTQNGGEKENASDDFQRWWLSAKKLHVIGKDILIPAHGVYWPIILKAFGYADDEIPTLLVHGWWNIGGAKMSKSLGNAIAPEALADKYGAEALRYYLMSDIATGKDADFSEERLVSKFNTDLANSLGNLLNRFLNMAAKYRDGIIKPTKFIFKIGQSGGAEEEPELAALVTNFPADSGAFLPRYAEYFGSYRVSVALEHAWDAVNACNALVDCAAPWKLAKNPAQSGRLDAVLYSLAESLRIIAILISPVLPKAARGIFDQLDPEQKLSREFRLEDARWGVLEDGHVVGKPTPLFPRIEAAS
jgi:methionyl-tRNA synthetase